MLRAVFERWHGRSGRDPDLCGADRDAFAGLHAAVQKAWDAGDLESLRQLTTPAMAAYFEGEFARLAHEGLRNVVAEVELLAAQPCEVRREEERRYTTLLLRWRMVDYFVRLAPPTDAPAIVSGDPRVPVEVEEMWTFVRRGDGGWLLSAIHQV